jgi:hypothetical protein
MMGTGLMVKMMAWRCVTPILLSSIAALMLCASFADASSCLPSAAAVREENPGAWPSWTMRAPGHEGTKCWYATTRGTARDHSNATALREAPTPTAREAPTAAPRVVSPKAETAPVRIPSAVLAVTNGVGWGPEGRDAPMVVDPVSEESSFDDRFGAVFEPEFFGGPSHMRRLADQAVTGPETPDQAVPSTEAIQANASELLLRQSTE